MIAPLQADIDLKVGGDLTLDTRAGTPHLVPIQDSRTSVEKDLFSPRFPLWIGAFASALLVIGFGGWAAFTSISGAVSGHGEVKVRKGNAEIQSSDGGMIERVLVEEGDRVSAGQPVLQLDGSAIIGEMDVLRSEYNALLARKARLQAERERAEKIEFPESLLLEAVHDEAAAQIIREESDLFEARIGVFNQKTVQLDSRRVQAVLSMQGYDVQLEALNLQQSLVDDQIERFEKLKERRLLTADRLTDILSERARLISAKSEILTQRSLAETRIDETIAEGRATQFSRDEEISSALRDLESRVSIIEVQRANLESRLAQLTLRAPISGVVQSLTVTTPKSFLRVGDIAMKIVPQDRPVFITAQVEPTDIDNVRMGQSVDLSLTSFDGRAMPKLIGRVFRVSPDVLLDERRMRSYFTVDIEISDQTWADLVGFELIPGMPVEIYFLTNEQSPMSYLISPFKKIISAALREP